MKADGDLQWQYNGAAPWMNILQWCQDHCGNPGIRWMYRWETIHFVREDDYAFFLLRWA
jgi:hypothetical protein